MILTPVDPPETNPKRMVKLTKFGEVSCVLGCKEGDVLGSVVGATVGGG
eukprot:gene32829-37071_t